MDECSGPGDLETQREMIQKQILALEKYVHAEGHPDLSSCSSLDDDESDDDELDNETGLDAKHEKIQREIKELQATLGMCTEEDLLSEKVDSAGNVLGDEYSDEEEEEEDDDDLELPQNVETCLEMNQVYQDVLREKLAELDQLLQSNRKQQREIMSHLENSTAQNSSQTGMPSLKMFIGNFMKPYFRDKVTGLGPPANPETKEIQLAGTNPCDEKKIKRWEGWQKYLLISAVVQDTTKRMIQPKLSKMEYIRDKMSKAEETEKEALQNQIKDLEVEIGKISELREEDLMGNRTDEHDWDKIANIDFEGKRDARDLKQFWQNYLHPSINKSPWNSEEIEKLKALVEKYKCHDWEMIAEKMETNRTAFMCFQAHQRYIYRSFKKRPWTRVEDRKLIDLIRKKRIGNFIPYTQISYFMDGRDASQCIYRWTSVLDPSIKKGPWSKEEDEMLLKSVQKHGVQNWWRIKFDVPGRTDGQVRDRYLDSLRADVKKGPWTREEEDLLRKAVQKYGVGKWSKIATEVPNRIDSQCLTKWKLLTKSHSRRKRPKAQSDTAPTTPAVTATPSNEAEPAPEAQAEKPAVKRKAKRKEKISDDEEISEGEIEYLESDCEEGGEGKKVDSPSEVSLSRYVQPPFRDWIPKQTPGALRLVLTKHPNSEAQSQSSTINGFNLPHVFYTVLDRHHSVVERFKAQQYQVPKQRTYEEDMILVPEYDVRSLYEIMGVSIRQATEKNRRKMERELCKPLKRVLHPKRGGAARAQIGNELMSVIATWMGNILLPLPLTMTQTFEVDVVRRQSTKVELSSTTVFLSFLTILHIDFTGCKNVISVRKNQVHAARLNPPAQKMGKRNGRKVQRPQHVSEPLKRIHAGRQPPQQMLFQAQLPQQMLFQPQQMLFQAQQTQICQLRPAPSSQHVVQAALPHAVQLMQPCLVKPPPHSQKGFVPIAPLPLPHCVQIAQPLVMSTMPPQPPVPTPSTVPPPSTMPPPSAMQPQSTVLLPSTVQPPSTMPPQSTSSTDVSSDTPTGQRKRARKPTAKAKELMEEAETKNEKRKKRPRLEKTPNTVTAAQTPPRVQDSDRLVVNGIPSLQPVATGLSLVNPPPGNACQTNTPMNIPNVLPTPVVFSLSSIPGHPPVMMPVLHNPNIVAASLPVTSVTNTVGRSKDAMVNVPSNALTTPSINAPGLNTSGPSTLLTTSSTSVQAPNDSATSSVLTTTASTTIESVTTNVPSTAVTTVSTSSTAVATSAPSAAPAPAPTTITDGCAALAPAAPYFTFSPIVPSLALPHALPTLGLPNAPLPVGLIQSNAASALPINGALPLTFAPALTVLPSGNHSQTTLQDAPSFDTSLMFLEDPRTVRDWLSGRRGTAAPPLEQRLPYLPPFVASVKTLQGLLKAKKSLLEHSLQIIPDRVSTYIGLTEEEDVAEVRKRVAERFHGNPAYLALKARFLACFTLPAVLATVHPCADLEQEEVGLNDL